MVRLVTRRAAQDRSTRVNVVEGNKDGSKFRFNVYLKVAALSNLVD